LLWSLSLVLLPSATALATADDAVSVTTKNEKDSSITKNSTATTVLKKNDKQGLPSLTSETAKDDEESSSSEDVEDDEEDAVGASSPADADDEHENGLIGRNPNYVGPVEEEYSDDEEEETVGSTKSTISKALKKGPRSKRRSISRKVARFVKKHYIQLILMAAIFAFRWELLSLLWRSMSQPLYDPETGNEVTRVFLWTPTSILKIVLFLALIAKLHQMSGDGVSPSNILLLGRLTGNSGLALILSSLLTPSNPAYLPPVHQHYTFEKLNDRYAKDHLALTKALGASKTINISSNTTTLTKELAAEIVRGSMMRKMGGTASGRSTKQYNSTLIVMDWTALDSTVSRMDDMRDEVSFLIHEHHHHNNNNNAATAAAATNEDASSPFFELVVLLQSPGGSAADYALAAQQLLRLRHAGIPVTCCVDKVAASGGYMIGCCSSPGRLFAAPFAVLGSIGVYSETVNVNRLLEGWGVRSLTFRGGRDKAPMSLIGEITKDGIRKTQNMVDDTHAAFKRHVVESRPIMADKIEDVATGEVWLGYNALKQGLIDRIITSDEYIGERIRGGARVLKLCKLVRHGLFSRPSASSSSSFTTAAKNKLTDHLSLISLLEDFQSILQRASDTLGAAIADDPRLDLSTLAHASEMSRNVQASASTKSGL